MASVVIKNWDNKTWLSSQNYINSFNNFLVKNTKINSNFKILDIGCGRGKILGSLKSRLKLKYKPKIVDGRAVPVSGVLHRFTYILDDE